MQILLIREWMGNPIGSNLNLLDAVAEQLVERKTAILAKQGFVKNVDVGTKNNAGGIKKENDSSKPMTPAELAAELAAEEEAEKESKQKEKMKDKSKNKMVNRRSNLVRDKSIG